MTKFDLYTIATAQTTALVFASLGRFEGKVDELFEQIDQARHGKDLMSALAAVRELVNNEKPDCAHVSATYIRMDVLNLPTVFNKLRARLLPALQDALAPAGTADAPLYEGKMEDWRVRYNVPAEEIPPQHRFPYDAKVSLDGPQVYVEVKGVAPDGHTEKVTVAVDIDRGHPIVRIGNDMRHSFALHVHSTPDGLLVSPGTNKLCIEEKRPAAGTALDALCYELEQQMPADNRSHIDTRRAYSRESQD